MNTRRYLKQACYYWPVEGKDASGQSIYGQPDKIRCRWDDVAEEFYTEHPGEVTVSKSKVMLEDELEIGGVLLLSEIKDLEDWDDLVFPDEPWHDENGRAAEIRQFSKIPDSKARKFLYIAWL